MTTDKTDKKEKLVSLEMTEEQKAEFVKFMAQKSAEKPSEPKTDSRPATITLQHKHWINGQEFAPGTHTLPEWLANLLAVHDNRATLAELKINQTSERMIKLASVGPSQAVVK